MAGRYRWPWANSSPVVCASSPSSADGEDGGVGRAPPSFSVPAPPALPPAPAGGNITAGEPASGLVLSRESLRMLQSSSIPPVRWATDFDNCASRAVFTMVVCTPLLPVFIGSAALDVSRANLIRRQRNMPEFLGRARLLRMMRFGGMQWAVAASAVGAFYGLRCSLQKSTDPYLRWDNASRLISGGVAGAVVGAYSFKTFLVGVAVGAVVGRFVMPAFAYWTGADPIIAPEEAGPRAPPPVIPLVAEAAVERSDAGEDASESHR